MMRGTAAHARAADAAATASDQDDDCEVCQENILHAAKVREIHAFLR